jgi:prepilin-type N-terminal cleavage/methylation domain-containing protein
MNRAPNIAATRKGLTLLELIVVLGILATLASSAVALVDRTDLQARFDDTRARLAVIERATLDVDRPDRSLAGYVVDLGELPSSLADLRFDPNVTPGTFAAFGPKEPSYSGVRLDGGAGDLLARELVHKGHRGPYIALGPGEMAYRDGFSNAADDAAEDALNAGWRVIRSADGLQLNVDSLGSDNAVGVTDGDAFAIDPGFQIGGGAASTAWCRDVRELRFELHASDAVDATMLFPDADELRLVVLVYDDADFRIDGSWKEVESEPLPPTLGEGSVTSVPFTLNPLDPCPIPVGEHLVFLAVIDTDLDPPVKLPWDDDGPSAVGGRRVSTRFLVRPVGIGEPIVLTIP